MFQYRFHAVSEETPFPVHLDPLDLVSHPPSGPCHINDREAMRTGLEHKVNNCYLFYLS
jgi:hypothetical protein